MALPDADSPARADFGVAVDGPRIVASGSLDEMRASYPDAQRAGGPDLVLLPGLVNSHDHGRGLGTAALGVPDDLLEVWLVGLAGQARIDPYLLAVYEGLRLARSGVTTVLHSHNLRDVEQPFEEIESTLRGYRDAGIRVAFDLPIVDQNRLAYEEASFLEQLPAELRAEASRPTLDRADYFALASWLLQQHHDTVDYLTTLSVGPSGPQWCSDALMGECLSFARQHGLRMHVHALETWYQREYGLRRWSTSVLTHLDTLGLLGPWLTLAHVVWPEPEDVALLAERRVGVAHNPSSNLRLRSGIAPVARLVEAGVPLGIGLDGHSLDDDQDYFRELRLAWTLANRPGASAPSVPAARIWQMGTRGGASITLGHEVALGRLETGHLADLVLVDRGQLLDDWSLGLHTATTTEAAVELVPPLLLRRATHHNVSSVMVHGKWIVRNGHSTCVDEEAVVGALREALTRIARNQASESPRLGSYLRQFYGNWGDLTDHWSA